ncbi:MAG: DUF4350 domain-containing protein, partial [Candidatus Thorarchaeota archaeon]
MKRVLPIIVAMLFLACIFITPAEVTNTQAHLQETPLLNDVTLEQEAELSWLPIDKTVRIAVYNTTNSTKPSYVTGSMNLNNSWIMGILTSAGYSVTEINLQDIQNHELQTRNYDVLVLADLVPNENITNLVKEFWLGGGGVLATDTSGEFLNFAGLLPREAENTNGYGVYWDYIFEGDFNVTNLHPVTKSYQVDDGLTHLASDFFMWDLSALTGTSLNGEFTVLVDDFDTSNNVKAIAVDADDMGGKIVHIGIPSSYDAPTGWDDMLVDAAEWLCPRPKSRVLFDLSHQPYYAVDPFDSAYAYNGGTTHETFRNDIVANGHTFDKLYPSASGNFTADNLAPYDVLIVHLPYLNFTASEVSAVTSWINSGGSLFVIGDFIATQRDNLNYLLSGTNFNFNGTTGASTLVQVDEHALHEDTTTVSVSAPASIDYPAPITSVWEDALGRVIIAVDEQGEGRIAVVGDVALLRENAIGNDDNRQVGINIMNWLTAGDVLVYIDYSAGAGHANMYKSQVTLSLNELGVKHYVTDNVNYFNISMYSQNWDMLIWDNINYNYETYYPSILKYLQSHPTTKLIMNTFWYHSAGDPLWDYIGFSPSNTYSPVPETYFWDTTHPIFHNTHNFMWGPLNDTADLGWGIAATNLTVYSNATALAGFTPVVSDTNVSVLLGLGGRALVWGACIAAYDTDYDNSSVIDSYEIWENQLAFMLGPAIDSPTDMAVEFGSVGTTLTWTPSSDRPYRYTIDRDSVEITDITWDGGPISVLFDGYLMGTYTFDVTVYDTAGSTATDTVVVTVEDTTAPAFVDAPDFNMYEEGTDHFYMNWSFTELNPDSWVLFINGSVQDSGAWDGSNVSADAGGLTEGIYNATILVNDTSGNSAVSSFTLTVTAPTTTT